MKTPRIWWMNPWLPYEFDVANLSENCSFTNADEIYGSELYSGYRRVEEFPVANLKLTIEGFDADLFVWNSRFLVSEKFRSAVSSAASDLQYFDVDSHLSTKSVMDKNYKIMHICSSEEALSVETDRNTLMGDRFEIASDFTPKARIFHDKNLIGYRLCTDEIAMSVLSSGCTGVRFFGTTPLCPEDPRKFRSLRGVELMERWNFDNGREETSLIEPIS